MHELETYEWGSMVWHPAPEADAEMSLAEMTIRRGCVSPPHRHGNCEELVFVQDGEVVVVVDGTRRLLGAQESLRVPRLAVHHVEAGDEDASLVVVWSAGEREYEAVPPGD